MGGCNLIPPYGELYEHDPLLLLNLTDPAIAKLDLSACELKEVPTQLQSLTTLQNLDLNDNTIQVRREDSDGGGGGGGNRTTSVMRYALPSI